MNVLIAGGSGFVGRTLKASLEAGGHQVWVLTRRSTARAAAGEIHWDGRTDSGWGGRINDMDAVVNLCGKSLASWPWTAARKQAFRDSRLVPGLALAQAIRKAGRPPRVLVQASGINFYGLTGETADESTPPGDDFLARLTVDWEGSTVPVEACGVRRVVIRSAVVLAAHGGMLPVMTLPVRLFAGGPLAGGSQALPWIHLADEVGAIQFLLENDRARGPFNLIAPVPTSNADFMRALAAVLRRPYGLPAPGFLLEALLGEMSVLITRGRVVLPEKLNRLGYKFQFDRPTPALRDIFSTRPGRPA